MKLLKCLSAVHELCVGSQPVRTLRSPLVNVPLVDRGEDCLGTSDCDRRQRYPVGILRPAELESLKADELFVSKSSTSRRARCSSIGLHPNRSNSATDRILAQVKNHLNCDETVFCLFNPGISNLPMNLFEAGARRMVLLEAEEDYLVKWKRFAGQHPDRVWAHHFNFGRLAEQTAQQLIRKQRFPLTPFFEQCGIQGNVEWKERGACSSAVTHPPIIFIGVLPPFNERSTFLCLLANRITRQNAFEFGPSEALLFVSSSKYVVLKEDQTALPKLTRYRRQEYRLYFDFDLVDKKPLQSFHPEIAVPKKPKYQRYVEHGKLDPNLLYLVHMKPKRTLPLDPAAIGHATVDHALAGLSFLHRQLLASPKATKLGSFLANLMPGIDQHLQHQGFDFSMKLESLTMRDIVALHSSILSWPDYPDSGFKLEVDAWLEMMWFSPTSTKPT
uniref:rRNA adenine N(6)-methyltransferase n=1 Tax=Trichuris muris TaxID=70415 RepID=A0A5S6QZX7_TRIMR